MSHVLTKSVTVQYDIFVKYYALFWTYEYKLKHP